MTEYICKCGRKLQRSTQSETTGNKLDGYAPGHECFGCPYVIPITRFENGHFVPDHYECVASKALRYETYASLFSFDRDSTAGHILSLDFDFLRRVAAECDKHEATISLNREKDGQMFHYKSKYRPDGRFDFTIYPTQNKAGANAKRAIFEKFFTDGGARKDLTPEQEKEKILADIAAGKAAAQKQEDTPMEIRQYKTDTGMIYAVRQQPEGGWRIMCRYPGTGWALTTDPRLSAECGCAESLQEVLDAYAQRKGWAVYDPPEASPTFSAAATAAAEEPASPPAEPALANTTAEPAAGSSEPEGNALAANPATSDLSQPAAFDYSGLDAQTVADLHLAEREYAGGKRMAEMGLRRMADGVAIAHDALCVTDATICRNGETGKFSKPDQAFGAWCESFGINRKAAERLMQVSKLFDGSSPRQQKVLEELSPSLLYAAAKPSAPAELVQAVKSDEIGRAHV